MLQFSIDDKKCTMCGACAAECPMRVIGFEKGRLPFIPAEKEEECIRCQHCLMVCPFEALSIDGKDPMKSLRTGAGLPDAASLETLIRSRRSYRKYADENVDPKTIARLLDAAAYAPTGRNAAAVRFNVVADRAAMAKVRDYVMGELSKMAREKKLPEGFEFFESVAELWNDKGVDVLFRSAPHLLVTSAPKDAPTPETDCIIAHSYFEIFAQANGLGTLWDGFMKWASAILPGLKKVLGVPENHEIGYFMVFGKPAVKYRRCPQRSAAGNVNYVKL